MMRDGISRRIESLYHALLMNPGKTSPEMRENVEAYSAKWGGSRRNGGALPRVLRSYVDKISRCAYQITDDDIENLKQAGYSEDQIYEVTLCAAVGAGFARLERALSLLQDSGDAPSNP